MAFVFKPKGRAKYYWRFRHPQTGRLDSGAGYVDRDATVQLATRKERDAARELEGIKPSEHLKTPILEHVAAFREHLISKGCTEKHAAMRESQIKAVVLGLSWSTLHQANGAAVEKLLSDWRTGVEGERNRFSAQTSNHYVASTRHFGRWLVRTGRLPANPFAHLAGVNAEADRRHVRRALDPADLAKLIETARGSAEPGMGLSGPQRAALYLAAARTGLRATELASLTPESFDLKGSPPTWGIGGDVDKAGRSRRLPVLPELAAQLRTYLPTVPAGTPLFPGPWAAVNAGAKMLRSDLKAAGVPYRTVAGVVDFHSLRVTFITDLARAGVPLQAAQKLARHCDPRLTANVYSRLSYGDLAAELSKVAVLPIAPPRRAQRKQP